MAKIYLAGPINGCTDAECNDWRTLVKEMLDFAGLEHVDPMRRDFRGIEGDHMTEIVEGDIADINECDFMIANAPKPSVGTSMEVFYQWLRSDSMIVDPRLGPMLLTGSTPDIFRAVVVTPKDGVSPWLRYHAVIVHSYEEAVEWVVKRARGE